MDGALASTRNLNTLVRRMLNYNLNMSSRLRNFERMHPTLAASTTSSFGSTSMHERSGKRATNPATLGFVFEEDLQTSRVYEKVALNESRFSKISSANSSGHSLLSWASLSDVADVSAISLPISPMELWNHHRYGSGRDMTTGPVVCSFEAWYNPPSMVGVLFKQYCT